MKILFLNRMVHQDPLGIMSLSATLKREGHDVEFLDLVLEDGWEDEAVAMAPDVVACSVLTGSQAFYLDACRKLKKRMDFLCVWGGPHPTFFPESLQEDAVDVLCIGEGEGAIVDLASAVDAGRPLEGIPNLHVKTSWGIVRNGPRPLVEDLDSLPFPDRSILDRYPQYRQASGRAVMASRGCPYACSFCFNSRLRRMYRGLGRYCRRRSVESLIEECARHRQDPWATQILFKDDLFAHEEGFVARFSEAWRREVALPFICNVRADRMTERMARDLAAAGARVVQFGVESGNDEIRRKLLRRAISRESMRDTARWLREAGIRVYTYNIVGLPGETPEQAMETLDFNAGIRPDIAIFTMFQPYPRTPLGDRAVAMGWSDGRSDDFSESYYENSMKNLPNSREFRNMVHLFPLASRFPLLRSLMPTLTRLPLTRAYRSVDFFYKSTRFIFNLGIVPVRDVALYSGRWVPRHPPRRSALPAPDERGRTPVSLDVARGRRDR